VAVRRKNPSYNPEGKGAAGRPRRFGLAVFLAIGIIVLLLAGTALGWALVSFAFPLKDYIVRDPQDSQLYRLKSNIAFPFKGMYGDLPPIIITTNDWGFRGPSVQPEKPPGTFHLLCFGDSYMFGSGVEFDDTLSQTLVLELRQRGLPAAADNFSVPGFTARQSVRLAARLAPVVAHDVLIFYFNDTDLVDEFTPPAGSLGETFLQFRLGQLYYLLIKPYLLSDRRRNASALVVDFAALRKDLPASEIFVINASPETEMKRALQQTGLPIVDVTAVHTDAVYFLSKRDRHLNAAGYRLVARRTAAALTQKR